MLPRDLRTHCRTTVAAEQLLRGAIQRLGLSARAYHRVLKIARTVADLAGAEELDVTHVGEAVQYRTLDRRRLPVAAPA
jgi:magnesium chelatase family protein